VPGRRFRLLADIAPLRESPAFRRLWIGSTLSQIGGGMTRFAVSLQAYEITRSSLAVGIIGLAQVVPTLTIGLAGGTFADSVDRRRLVLATSSGLAVVTGALAAQAVAGLRTAWLLYALVAIQAALIAVRDGVRLIGRSQPLAGAFLADYVVAAGGSQVGYLESGALTSPAISALSGGVAGALAALVIGVALPGLRRFRYQALIAGNAVDSGHGCESSSSRG
jgi:Transmembrane secretion effector